MPAREDGLASGVGVLKLRLGASLVGPSKRLAADLHAVAAEYNRACNAMVRHWERWAEDNPNAVQGERMELPKGFVTQLYHAGRAAAPAVASKIVSSGSQEIMGKKQLLKRVPWDHRRRGGTARRVWQAILRHETARPCYRTLSFPVPCQDARLTVVVPTPQVICLNQALTAGEAVEIPLPAGISLQAGQTLVVRESGKRRRKEQVEVLTFTPGKALLRRLRWSYSNPELVIPDQTALCNGVASSEASATLRFPLFSKESGREHKTVLARLEVRQLPDGIKRVLNRVASGQWKLSDSTMVYHEPKNRKGKGSWFFHMTYQQPQQPLGLNPANIATLETCAADQEQPFTVAAGHAFPWQLGPYRPLVAEYHRLSDRRLFLRDKYRNAPTSGSKGHGRGRFEGVIRPLTRAARQLMERFAQSVVAEVVRYCTRYDCGTVVYQEPSPGLRKSGWFARKDIPFDWTGFVKRLAHKLWLYGIELRVERARPVRKEKETGDG